jgi:hypothetical protein
MLLNQQLLTFGLPCPVNFGSFTFALIDSKNYPLSSRGLNTKKKESPCEMMLIEKIL